MNKAILTSGQTFLTLLLLMGILFSGGPAMAQQVNIGSSMQRTGDSFSESIGSSWGVSGKNWFANFGGGAAGGNNATPQFGGYNQSNGLNSGLSFQRGDVSGGINFWASQSSERSNTMNSASTTIMNGQQGYIGDVSEHPFVVGVTPVVGNYGRRSNYGNSARQSNTVLQEKLQRLEYEKRMQRQYADEDEPVIFKKSPTASKAKSKTVNSKSANSKSASSKSASMKSKSGKSKSTAKKSYSSVGRSGPNPGTAERAATSVREMKRKHAAQNE